MSDPYFGLLSEVPYVSQCLRTSINQQIIELIILVVEYSQLLQLGIHRTWEVHIIENYSLRRREIYQLQFLERLAGLQQPQDYLSIILVGTHKELKSSCQSVIQLSVYGSLSLNDGAFIVLQQLVFCWCLQEFIQTPQFPFKGGGGLLLGKERKQTAVELHSLTLLVFKKLLSEKFSQDWHLLEVLDNLLRDFLHEETKLDKTRMVFHHLFQYLYLVRVANWGDYS